MTGGNIAVRRAGGRQKYICEDNIKRWRNFSVSSEEPWLKTRDCRRSLYRWYVIDWLYIIKLHINKTRGNKLSLVATCSATFPDCIPSPMLAQIYINQTKVIQVLQLRKHAYLPYLPTCPTPQFEGLFPNRGGFRKLTRTSILPLIEPGW